MSWVQGMAWYMFYLAHNVAQSTQTDIDIGLVPHNLHSDMVVCTQLEHNYDKVHRSHNSNWNIVPCPQSGPSHPAVQLHMSGAMQWP